MHLEYLEQLQFPTELAPGIADYRHRLVTQRHAKGARAQHKIHASHIGQGEIPAIGDMPVQVQVQRPDTHAHHRGSQAVNRFAPGAAQQHVQ